MNLDEYRAKAAQVDAWTLSHAEDCPPDMDETLGKVIAMEAASLSKVKVLELCEAQLTAARERLKGELAPWLRHYLTGYADSIGDLMNHFASDTFE